MIAQSDPVAKRLQQLRGVGPIIATALVAAVGNGEQFANGRQMSAAFGLTPRQHSSGGKERLLGISKRGDVYLRALLIHGARATISTAKNKNDRLSQWMTRLAARSHPNVAAVAMAKQDHAHGLGDVEERHRLSARHGYQLKTYSPPSSINRVVTGAHPPRLLSKPNDGEQVEPAPADPENVHVREARRSNGELARE